MLGLANANVEHVRGCVMRIRERISNASLIAVGMAAGCCLLGGGLALATAIVVGECFNEMRP